MLQVQLALPVSERRAFQVLDQPRGTQRYVTQEDEEEQRLMPRLHELVRDRPRYGYRFMVAILRREGWRVNRKRVYRLWQQEGFQVPRKQRKKRRLGSSAGGCIRRRAEHKDHVWAWDFVFDRTANGRSLKWLSIVDEYTREGLARVREWVMLLVLACAAGVRRRSRSGSSTRGGELGGGLVT